MAAKRPVPTPRYCIQQSRFTKQDGWQLYHLSLSLNGNIAVTGFTENTKRTYIDVYTNVRHSDSRDKPNIIYSKEFEKYKFKGRSYWGRFVSFYPGSDTMILSGLGDKLQVIDLIQDRVLKARKIKLVKHAGLRCLSVRETEIFIGFWRSNKITVIDVINLNEIKSIKLQGIRDGYYPYDMIAITDTIFVCITDYREESNEKSLIIEEKNGRILSELTKPTDTVKWYVEGLALNIMLNVIAVAWSQTYKGESKGIDVIVFYSLLGKNNCSFLIVEVEFGVFRIRISDRGDRMACMDRGTEEWKVYDMAEFLTYHQLKEKLALQLQLDDCVRLMNYFDLPKDQSEPILNSGTSAENLLSVLEERGVIQPFDVGRLIRAFRNLNISSLCYHLVDFYKRTRVQATSYDKFLATLSAHLIASLTINLCDYFNITDENKTCIVSSQNPGLSLLLSLDEIGIIKKSEVAALEPPFTEMKLVQAVAMIHEYQSIVEEEKKSFLREIEIADERKREFFVQCLRRKIRSWYETMTPVPWRKSCKWSVSDLFVGSPLILTDSRSKRSLLDVDEKCKVKAKEIFCHDRLKYETRIVLEGDAGCGKTMLMSQLAYDWSQGKLNDIKLLILLPLKFVQQRTLVETIKEFYLPEDENLSISDIEKFLDDRHNPAHLLLDGLEEYNGKLKQEKSEVSEIISGEKYPVCKVLISSRSDCAKNLPKIPMLKLGKFGKNQRSCYIEKLFPEDSKKQMETKQIIDDSPIIQDLCSVPLLFVLTVHNAENMGKAQVSLLDRVTPFVKGMVDILYPVTSLVTKERELILGDRGQKEASLEELAFNGLCRGNQQLYWQKEFFDEKIQNSKEWIDSGVLVIEESCYSVQIDKTDQYEQSADTEASDFNVFREEDNSQPGLGGVAEGQSDNDKHSQMRVEEDSDKDSDARTGSDEVDTETSSEEEEEIKRSDNNGEESIATEVGVSIAKHVPLQVRFLHKIIQEWFAAKYFSSMISRVNVDHLEKYLYEYLPLINPGDLHYVLRFTCALVPLSCHIIIKHLLSNRSEEGDVPEYIMNCVFLCLAEYTGDYSPDMLEVLSEICMENIMIHGDDSRLLQQSKVMLLEVASSHGIQIRKLLLADLVVSTNEDVLQFNSGIMMIVLETLEMIELSRWDQNLKEEDYSNILKFIAKSPVLRKASLKFPDQPPRVDKGTLVSLQEKDQTVMWIIGSKLSQILDPATGKWELLVEIPPDAQKQKTEVDEKQMQQPSISCLPGTYADAKSKVLKSQGTQKQTKRDSIPDPGVTEKLTKDFKEGTPFGGFSKSQLAGCHNVQKTIITKIGGTLEISNTGIALVIPPNALPADKESYEIQMRCIPRRTLKDPVKYFSSNSSAVVEILPALVLQYPVRLSLPHCLVLQQNVERKAKIFVSHHDKENQPFWEEQKDVSYHVEDTTCIVFLNSFSWYTYSVEDDIVTAKKLVVYAAAQKLESHDDAARIEVGCYPDLPGNDKEIQCGQNLLVAHKKILYFEKREEQCPLRISLNDIFPSGWGCRCKCGFPDTHSQEIPYSKIWANNRSSCVYILEKKENVPGRPLCVFTASQKMGNTAVQLAVNFQVLDKNTSTAGIMGNQCEPSLKAESSITKSGGELQIKDTGVVLKIPPNALKGKAKHQFVHMRIISNRIIEDQGTSLSSNSCTAVEIFPHNISLRKPAELRLPHCLMFNETRERCARIFTNHGKGSPASWNEDKTIQQALDENACVIKLTKLCGVKYFIDDKVVRGKKIRVYTAAKEVEQKNEVAEIEVGYYPYIPGSGEILRMNPSFTVDSEETLPFMEEQKTPLQLNLMDISPPRWARWFPKDKPWDIPFEVVASSIEHSHLFILQKTNKGVGSVFCRFTALQKGDERATTLAQTLLPKEVKPKDTEQSEEQGEKADSMNVTIKYLSSKMGDRWKPVGRNLGLEDAVLDAIEMDYKRTQEQSYQMLRQWKQRNGTDATHTKLIRALIEAGRKDLAEDVQNRKDQEDA